MKATAVSVDGPYSRPGRDGDEYPYWAVCIVDADGDPIGKVYQVGGRGRAIALGEKIANDRRLPLDNEAGFA